MSSAEASGADAGKVDPAVPGDIQGYVSAVDDLLLDVPWRRRRELIAGLEEHLRENPEQITIESPQEYAAELRATSGAVPGGLLAGFRSASWPTPIEWWESVLRGAAILLVALLGYKLLDHASYAVVGDSSAVAPWPVAIDSALRSLYPVPAFRGSTWDGLLIYGLLSVLIGQLTTAAVLSRSPHRRRKLRLLSYVGLAIVIVTLGYGALRSLF
jgi:hypothetical protein